MNERVRIDRIAFQDHLLRTLIFPNGALTVTLGFGSGLCAAPGGGTLFAIGDRGPNIKAKQAEALGLSWAAKLNDAQRKAAKILIDDTIGPEIAELKFEGETVTLVKSMPLTAPCGRAITGRSPLPHNAVDEYEPVFTARGEELGPDPYGADTEGIAALSDGSFWIAEEYVPSLLHVQANGVVTERLVPARLEHFFAGASFAVRGALPAILARRKLNRGFEAICLSADEAELIVALQSPLAHPDRAAHEASDLVRILVLDAASGHLKRQYAYPLDPPQSFARDMTAEGAVAPGDRKICEMLRLPPEADGAMRLIVLERVSHTSKLYAVTLAPNSILPDWVDDLHHRPALEQLHEASDRTAAGVFPLRKTCLLDSDDHPGIHADLEGMALLAPDQILLVNDNDFGVEGQTTRFVQVSFDWPL